MEREGGNGGESESLYICSKCWSPNFETILEELGVRGPIQLIYDEASNNQELQYRREGERER